MWRHGETPDLRSERHFPTEYGKPFKSRLQRMKTPKIDLYHDSKSSCPSVHLRQRKPPVPQTVYRGQRDRRFGFFDCSRTDDFVSFFIRGCHSSLFKRHTGQTLNDYITSVRLQKASELLRTHGCYIYEAADRVGYKDVAYFSKLFKQQYGCTPAEYKAEAHR